MGIFPLRFYLFILYFVFVLAFFLKPIVDAKGEGETLLVERVTRVFFGPIIEQSRVKPVQTQITLETQLKVTLLMVFDSLIWSILYFCRTPIENIGSPGKLDAIMKSLQDSPKPLYPSESRTPPVSQGFSTCSEDTEMPQDSSSATPPSKTDDFCCFGIRRRRGNPSGFNSW